LDAILNYSFLPHIWNVYPSFFQSPMGPLHRSRVKIRGHIIAHRTPLSPRTRTQCIIAALVLVMRVIVNVRYTGLHSVLLLGHHQHNRNNFQKRHRTSWHLKAAFTYGFSFYHAMHFSARRSIAIACRLSVRLSVCNVGEL